jgi:hypothetical protein
LGCLEAERLPGSVWQLVSLRPEWLVAAPEALQVGAVAQTAHTKEGQFRPCSPRRFLYPARDY